MLSYRIPLTCRFLVACLLSLPISLPLSSLITQAQQSEAHTPITPSDVARLESISSAHLSPDGHHIAYLLSRPRNLSSEENGPAWSELHVMDRSGKSRPFITGSVSIQKISWGPDGQSITYLAKRGSDKSTRLYAIPLEGGEAYSLVESLAAISGYEWSPDGKHLALLMPEQPSVEVENQRKKGFNAEIYEEDNPLTQVWIATLKEDRRSTSLKRLEHSGHASAVKWHPRDNLLAVAIAPTSLVDDQYMAQKIHVLSLENEQVQTTIQHSAKLADFDWSPDGTQIAFLGGRTLNDPSPGRLFLADAKSGEYRELAESFVPNFEEIHWGTSDLIYFIAEDGCLRTMGQVQRQTGAVEYFLPKEGPILGKMSTDSRQQSFTFIGSTERHPDELFLYEKGNPILKRMTLLNGWLEQRAFGKQEIIRYPARDGEWIEGVLIYPSEYQEGQRYPLIVNVHGGPESSIPHGWLTRYSSPGQVAAGEGYFVFLPNYRGSTGRGVAFAMAHQADYAGKEFDDIVDGVDYLIEQGKVIRCQVGVTGGSYGGYATAWCSTKYSDRFAAGVMFVGISNQISKSGTTDIPEEMYLVHGRKRIWEDWQFFLERSPIYHVENAKTPLLILHGKSDPRVHPSQSMELYRHLKTLGNTPVRLVLYPGEGHGNANAAARLDFNLRMMRWFNHYLKGPGGDKPPIALDYPE